MMKYNVFSGCLEVVLAWKVSLLLYYFFFKCLCRQGSFHGENSILEYLSEVWKIFQENFPTLDREDRMSSGFVL